MAQAKSRMFIVHQPSGLAVCLSTSNDQGWQVDPDMNVRLALLFDTAQKNQPFDQEAFTLMLESSSGQIVLPGHFRDHVADSAVPEGLFRLVRV